MFKKQTFPEQNPEAEKEIIDRIRDAVLGDEEEVDSRTAILVGIAGKAGLLVEAMSRYEIRGAMDRIRRIGNGDLVSEEARAALGAAIAVVRTATIAAAAGAAGG